MPSLANATVVIAGASSGMGLATALAFARRGANLVLGARRGNELRRAAMACEELGARAVPFELDVGDEAQVQRLTDAAVSCFGRIDIWFNNAGVGAVGPFEQVPLDAHIRVVRTNLLGVIHGSHAAVRQFLAQDGRGVLINMASVGGVFPVPFGTSYAASKFGIAGFTDSLRAELAIRTGIEVCGVYPTFVDTPAAGYAGNYSGHVLDAFRPNLEPEEVAERIVGLVHRPRRALFIGGVPAPRLMAALTPDGALRRAARIGRTALRQAPPAEPTIGNLMEPPQREASTRGEWRSPPPVVGAARTMAIALGVGAAALLLFGAGRSLAARRR
jgi:NAD(P)-dependent dehydrogenase (short-subunit alcohol dehydrogenase family)